LPYLTTNVHLKILPENTFQDCFLLKSCFSNGHQGVKNAVQNSPVVFTGHIVSIARGTQDKNYTRGILLLKNLKSSLLLLTPAQ
jgi:hypothetical protein